MLFFLNYLIIIGKAQGCPERDDLRLLYPSSASPLPKKKNLLETLNNDLISLQRLGRKYNNILNGSLLLAFLLDPLLTS